MKIYILTISILLSFNNIIAQAEPEDELYCDLHEIDILKVSQSQLKAATTISEIYDRYPSSWVKEYISVEVVAKTDGVLRRIIGKDYQLTTEQRKILSEADVDTDVQVNVKYMPDNTLTQNEVQTINFSLAVLPENYASFPGGDIALQAYLEKNIETPVKAILDPETIDWIAVKFTVDQDGNILVNAPIGSTKDAKVDELINTTLCNMPRWIPAKDSKGQNVSQEYEFVMGNTGKICGLNVYYMTEAFME